MIKALFFDIDGTLVSKEKGTYSCAIKEALTALRKKGFLLFVATGRAPVELQITNIINGLSFDAIISLNGQFCYNNYGTIYINTLNKEDVRRVIEQIRIMPYACAFIEKDYMYVNRLDQQVMVAQAAINTPPPPVENIDRALENDVLMIMPYLNTQQIEQYTKKVLKHSKITRWNEFACDVVPFNSGKILGIQKVLDYYQLEWSEIMAFGDAENDMEMVQRAKIGVAMGNSESCVKDVADYITDDVDQDGIVSALQYYDIL